MNGALSWTVWARPHHMIFCSPALILSIETLQNTGMGRKPFLVSVPSCLNFFYISSLSELGPACFPHSWDLERRLAWEWSEQIFWFQQINFSIVIANWKCNWIRWLNELISNSAPKLKPGSLFSKPTHCSSIFSNFHHLQKLFFPIFQVGNL